MDGSASLNKEKNIILYLDLELLKGILHWNISSEILEK